MKISELIHTVENEFQARFSFSLFTQIPANQISTIDNDVNSSDEFKSRLASAAAVFDYFHKKEMDRETAIDNTGTRKSFECFLKAKFPNCNLYVDDNIVKRMNMICLLRDYYIHGKNRNKEKAIEYFKITDPIVDYAMSWNSVYEEFKDFIYCISTLLKNLDLKSVDSEKWNYDTVLSLVDDCIGLMPFTEIDATTKAMIREVIETGPITDLDLSNIFQRSIIDVRLRLYKFTERMFNIEYVGEGVTKISIHPFFYSHKDKILSEVNQ